MRSARLSVAPALALALLTLLAAAAVPAAARTQRSVERGVAAGRPIVELRSRSLSVRQGTTVRDRLDAVSAHGRRWVALHVGRPIPGTQLSVRPAVVAPGRHSSLIIRTGRHARAGRYMLRIFGSVRLAGGRSRRFVLRVKVRLRASARRASLLAMTAGASGSVASHVASWAYDDCSQGSDAPSTLVQSWVSFAESNCGPSETKALQDCPAGGSGGCTAVQYVDANHIYAQGSLPVAASAGEDWWLHQPGYSDASHRIQYPGYGGGYDLNQDNPQVERWIDGYVQRNYDAYGALMMDDTSGSLSNDLWGSGFATANEVSTNAALQAAHEKMAASLAHADGTPFVQIDNGITSNDYVATPLPLLNDPSSVVGLVAEGQPMDDGTLERSDYYATLLDEMAYVDATNADFMVLLSYDTSGSQRARLVQEVTTLLGYGDGHTVDWADLNTDSSDLAVWPEEGIVPTEPLQSMQRPDGSGCLAGQGEVCSGGGHNDLQVAPGIYVREFKMCYDRGSAFGPCAALMNTTGSDVVVKPSWLTQAYTSQVTLDGGDVQSGGAVNVAGAPFTAGATTIPAKSGLLISS